MANAMTLDMKAGEKPASPTFVLRADFALDTYAAGGVSVDALLEANLDFKNTKLPASSIFAGFCALDADAAGVARVAEFDAVNRKIILKKAGAGPALVEESAGPIGATVNGKLTAFLV
jgi:hypothetical protein